MQNGVFSPANIQVTPGTEVTWVNDDAMVHTVTADDASFNSGNIAPGAIFRFVFQTLGTYNYHCEIHSGMRGTVSVLGR